MKTGKELKSIPWGTLAEAERSEYCTWLAAEDLGYIPDMDDPLRVRCTLCQAVIFPKIARLEWVKFFWKEEQEHLASDQHVQNITLRRLAD